MALFEWLWNGFSNTLCPVGTGRGVSAAADWGANKQITLPDKRGKLAVGLDDMGNSAASRFTGVPFTTGSGTAAGSLGGEATHTLATTEIPAHSHSITDPGHSHNSTRGTFAELVTAGSGGTDPSNNNFAGDPTTASATTSITINNTGGGTAHNIMPPIVTGTFFRKL
jgi:microcystin-dependent protein